MESDFDFCARRAAEEFMAAGRATSAAERLTHRQLAEKYAEVVRQLMSKRRAEKSSPLDTNEDEAQAA